MIIFACAYQVTLVNLCLSECTSLREVRTAMHFVSYLSVILLLKCACQSLGAGVKRLQKLGMVTGVPGMAALDMNTAEDAVVRNTREVVPGMVICGMEVRTAWAA